MPLTSKITHAPKEVVFGDGHEARSTTFKHSGSFPRSRRPHCYRTA